MLFPYNSFNLASRWSPIVSAYNDGMTVHELVHCLRKMTDELYINETKLNEKMDNLIEFIEKEGLQRYTIQEIRRMYENGELATIINEEIFGSLNDKIRLLGLDLIGVKDQLLEEVSNTNQMFKMYTPSNTDSEVNVQFYMDGVADGVKRDFTTALQMALNSKYTTIKTPRGTYPLTKSIKLPSGKTLSMYGTEIVKANNMNTMFVADSPGLVGGYNAISNITILGGTIDLNGSQFAEQCGGFAFGHGNNVIIQDVQMKNLYDWHYLELNAMRDVQVINCIFDGNINPSGTEMVQIDLAKSSGEFPWYGPFDSTPCDNITVKGCVFKNGRIGFGSHTATNGIFHSHIKLVDNEFRNMSKYGIYLLNTNDVVVSNNQFDGVLIGISAGAVTGDTNKNYTITGNTISNAPTDEGRGIHIRQHCNEGVISGNLISRVGRHAIGVDYSTRWTVANNTTYFCGSCGIWLYSTTRSTVTGNTVTESNVDKITDRYGIQIGFLQPASTANTHTVNVNGNLVDSMSIKFTSTVFINNNIVESGSYVLADNVNQISKGNVVQGVYIP